MYKPRARQRSDGKWVVEHPIKEFSGQGDTIAEARTDMAYHFWRARAMQMREESYDMSEEIKRLEFKASMWGSVSATIFIALVVSLSFHILPHLPF